MIQLRVLAFDESAGFCRLMRGFKAYASMPDDSQEGLLIATLKSAVLKVQESTDKPIVPTQLELVSSPERGMVRLYQGNGCTVNSVVDAYGRDLTDYALRGNMLRVNTGGTVTVVYTTAPTEGDFSSLTTYVYRYATALLDGADAATLGTILREALC